MNERTHPTELQRYVVGHVVTFRQEAPLYYSGAAGHGDSWTIGQKAPGVLARNGDQFIVEALNVPRALGGLLGTTYFVVLRSVATGCPLATVMDDCRFMGEEMARAVARNRQAREEILGTLGQGHLGRLLAACGSMNLAVLSAFTPHVSQDDWERMENEDRVKFWPRSTPPSSAAEIETWNRFRDAILRDHLTREGFAHVPVETASPGSCGGMAWPVQGAKSLLVIGSRVSDNYTHFRGVLTKWGTVLGQERILLIPTFPTDGGSALVATTNVPRLDEDPSPLIQAGSGEPGDLRFRWPQFTLTAHDEQLAADRTGKAIYDDLCGNSKWSCSSWCGYWADNTRRKLHPEGFPIDAETLFPSIEHFESVISRNQR